MAGRTSRTAKKDETFFVTLAATGNVSDSAATTGYGRRSVYEWRDKDEEFKARWNEALAKAGDVLEAEARRRAVEGWEEPVFYRGKSVGKVRKYSDTLLIFLLKGNKPDKFKDRHEHTGEGGGPVSFVMNLHPDNG